MQAATIASTPRTRSTAQRTLIVAFAILQVLVTLLPAFGVGQPIGERSDAVQTLITPAGWAFSIWGALYAGCLAYAIYQALPARKHDALLDRIGWYSAGAFLGNAAWAVYAQLFGLSVISVAIILFTLICLLRVYQVFIGRPGGFTTGEQWLVVLPLSALAAWLTAASIVNVAAALEYHGVSVGAAGPLIAAIVVVIGGVIAAAAIWAGRGNPWYSLVFVWALAATYAAAGKGTPVALASILSVILVGGAAIIRLAQAENRRRWLHATS